MKPANQISRGYQKVNISPCNIFSTTSMICWSDASRPCGEQETEHLREKAINVSTFQK